MVRSLGFNHQGTEGPKKGLEESRKLSKVQEVCKWEEDAEEARSPR